MEDEILRSILKAAYADKILRSIFQSIEIPEIEEEVIHEPRIFREGEKIFYKNRPSNVYKIIQRQGNNHYTCIKLIIEYQVCRTKYVDTDKLELLNGLFMKPIPRKH